MQRRICAKAIPLIEPKDDENVQYGLTNVIGQTGMAGIMRQYDIFFTDTGIAFVVIVSGKRMLAGAAGAGGFGAVGGLIAGSSTSSSKVKVREQFNGLTVKQILKLNEKSFFMPYADVKEVRFKKGMTGVGKMKFTFSDGKFETEFSKDQVETATAALAEKLKSKLAE